MLSSHHGVYLCSLDWDDLELSGKVMVMEGNEVAVT